MSCRRTIDAVLASAAAEEADSNDSAVDDSLRPSAQRDIAPDEARLGGLSERLDSE